MMRNSLEGDACVETVYFWSNRRIAGKHEKPLAKQQLNVQDFKVRIY